MNLSSKQKDWILCALIAFLGAILRFYQYDIIPKNTFTFDEYAFAWSGMSLIQDGLPKSWSYLSAYSPELREQIAFLGKTNLYLVSPWLDHPPLFSLIIGSVSLLAGAKSFFDCSVEITRIPSLLFGISSIVVFYFLTRTLYNTKVAVISSLIFATDPSLVFLSRLTVSENFIILLGLSSILCFIQYIKTTEKNYLYLSIFWAGIAPLAKVTGIFIVLLLFILLIYKRKWRESLLAIFICSLMFSLYFFYGWFYDFELFQAVLQNQSKRFNSILLFKNIIFQTGMPFFDPWLIFGWLTLITSIKLSSKQEQTIIISLPIIIYLYILLFSGAQSHFYPWYIIPLYPFIFLALGKFLERFHENPDFLVAALIIIFIGTWSINYGLGNPWSNFYLLKLRGFKYLFILTISFLTIPFFVKFLITNNFKINRFTQVWSQLIFLIFILINIMIVYNLQYILSSNLVIPFTIVQ